MSDRDDRSPEKPRYEPEIIPPSRGDDPLWIRIDSRSGTRRIHLAQPGLFSIVLGLVLLGLVAALIVLLLAGVLLFWIPIIVGGVALALLWGAIRFRWRMLQDWWAHRR